MALATLRKKRGAIRGMIKPYYDEDGITIYHGDCREILPTLSNVTLVFTDPPYGHNNNNGDLIHKREAALGKGKVAEEDGRPIANDGREEASELVKWLFSECRRMLSPDGCCCCCCCGGGGPDPQFARWSLWMNECLKFKQMVVWDKGPIGMGWHYRRSYETVLIGDKGKCKWRDDSDAIENIIRPGAYGIRKIIPSADDHPTPKPWQLAAHFIKLHTDPGDLVVDPFMGGGSTAEACKMLGRRFIGCELDERWIEIAVNRLAQKCLDFSAA